MVKEIHVTKDNIMEGEPGNASTCAIACAIADTYNVKTGKHYQKHYPKIGVEDSDSIFIDYGNCWTHIQVEPEDLKIVEEFIKDFDSIEDLPITKQSLYRNEIKELKFRYTEVDH